MANKKTAVDYVRTGIEEITTQGDLLYRGATDLKHLPKGTSGQTLTMGGSNEPEWATPSGGATALIARNTFTDASTIEITSGFDSSTYDSYLLMVDCSSISSPGSMMGIRTSSNGGSSFDSTSGDYKYGGYSASSGSGHVNSSSTSSHNIPFDASNLTATGFQLELVILRPDITSNTKTLRVHSSYIDASGHLVNFGVIGQRVSNGLVNGIQLMQWGSMLLTGTYQFIGYKKA